MKKGGKNGKVRQFFSPKLLQSMSYNEQTKFKNLLGVREVIGFF